MLIATGLHAFLFSILFIVIIIGPVVIAFLILDYVYGIGDYFDEDKEE